MKSVSSSPSILDICIFRSAICQTPHRLRVISWLCSLDILWLANYGALFPVLSSRTSARLKPHECKRGGGRQARGISLVFRGILLTFLFQRSQLSSFLLPWTRSISILSSSLESSQLQSSSSSTACTVCVPSQLQAFLAAPTQGGAQI